VFEKRGVKSFFLSPEYEKFILQMYLWNTELTIRGYFSIFAERIRFVEN